MTYYVRLTITADFTNGAASSAAETLQARLSGVPGISVDKPATITKITEKGKEVGERVTIELSAATVQDFEAISAILETIEGRCGQLTDEDHCGPEDD